MRSPGKISLKSHLDGKKDRFGSGNKDHVKSISSQKINAVEDETATYYLYGDPILKNESIGSRTSRDKLRDNDVSTMLKSIFVV